MNRVLLYPQDLNTGTANSNSFSFAKHDERFRHIKKILHLKEGDTFKAGIINGKLGTAEIIRFSETELHARFYPEEPSIPLPNIRLILGFPRPIQLRRILRDIAGLGVEALYLTGTDLGEKSYLQADLAEEDTIRRLLIDGCAQAGQTLIPEIYKTWSLPSFFSEYNANYTKEAVRAVLDVPFPSTNDSSPAAAPLTALKWQNTGTLWIAIGNERGWSNAERRLFAENGFYTYTMGNRIMRTETAVTAALAVCLAQAGCWDGTAAKD